MKPPDVPADEQDRLKTLRSLDVLDTLAEDRFDRITRIATRLFDVPIALVSLVDENRQWFKSCVGLGVTETARDISFCGHSILGSDVLVILDTAADERFADNPLVTHAPYIRFYAGCPLNVNGRKLGTLCIIDVKAREFGEADTVTLRDLAAMVERELMAVQLATFDELTGLSNRRGFLVLANGVLALCDRNGLPAAMVLLDLNGFKAINDKLGHAEGDQALRTFASSLDTAFRASDAVGRLGGDEFAVLLTGTDMPQAETKMRGLVKSVAERGRAANRGYDLRFSYGIVEFKPGSHEAVEQLLARADALMYAHKSGAPDSASA